jgi:dTMP kinase
LGKLIVLEGIDGSGKTTLQRGIAAALAKRGHDVVTTKEPTEGPLGKKIREMAQGQRERVSKEEELALFHEDRKIHVDTVVRPALRSGAIVVQDRSYFSTVAYQGERGFDRAELTAMGRAIAPDPDLLIVVDVPAELALERIHASRPSAADDFERLESLQRIRRVFQDLPGAVVLDGRLSEHDLLDRAIDLISKRLSLG